MAAEATDAAAHHTRWRVRAGGCLALLQLMSLISRMLLMLLLVLSVGLAAG